METSESLLEILGRNPADQTAWRRLDDLYRPLLRRWFLRDPDLRDEVDDLVQDVMAVILRELPDFHRQRSGSFRRWLRETTFRRLQACYRRRAAQPRARGGALKQSPLAQLSDPGSELSRQWEEEHNHHLLTVLLDRVRPQFHKKSLAAFERLFFDELPPAQVAEDLGMSVNAVLLARSRILARLRLEARDLID
jgi:RNA polymerase sigma-70 factor (ECF subfamily)